MGVVSVITDWLTRGELTISLEHLDELADEANMREDYERHEHADFVELQNLFKKEWPEASPGVLELLEVWTDKLIADSRYIYLVKVTSRCLECHENMGASCSQLCGKSYCKWIGN